MKITLDIPDAVAADAVAMLAQWREEEPPTEGVAGYIAACLADDLSRRVVNYTTGQVSLAARENASRPEVAWRRDAEAAWEARREASGVRKGTP